jgi:hypothetical protein
MGDSVLDNFYWLDKKKEDLAYQLTKKLQNHNSDSICTNLALDETEVPDIMNGKIPSLVYAKERANIKMKPYQVNKDGVFFPLEQLEVLFKESKTKPTHVVLSMGGNDCRVRLNLARADSILSSLKSADFEFNYRQTVETLIKLVPNVILVLVYKPGKTFYSLFPALENQINILAQSLAPIIFKIARDYKLPIIDLSRTFNPDDLSHYGSTPIEPSNKSSMFICEHVDRIVSNFKFGEEESNIYYGIDENTKCDKNTSDYIYSSP